MPRSPVFSVKHVAKKLLISKATVNRYVSKGILKQPIKGEYDSYHVNEMIRKFAISGKRALVELINTNKLRLVKPSRIMNTLKMSRYELSSYREHLDLPCIRLSLNLYRYDVSAIEMIQKHWDSHWDRKKNKSLPRLKTKPQKKERKKRKRPMDHLKGYDVKDLADKIIEMWIAGASTLDIAKKFGVSIDTVKILRSLHQHNRKDLIDLIASGELALRTARDVLFRDIRKSKKKEIDEETKRRARQRVMKKAEQQARSKIQQVIQEGVQEVQTKIVQEEEPEVRSIFIIANDKKNPNTVWGDALFETAFQALKHIEDASIRFDSELEAKQWARRWTSKVLDKLIEIESLF